MKLKIIYNWINIRLFYFFLKVILMFLEKKNLKINMIKSFVITTLKKFHQLKLIFNKTNILFSLILFFDN